MDEKEFVPQTRYVSLERKVLAVAKTRIPNHWAAYIASVPGQDHSTEYKEVLANGTKLREEVARVLFKEFADLPYAK